MPGGATLHRSRHLQCCAVLQLATHLLPRSVSLMHTHALCTSRRTLSWPARRSTSGSASWPTHQTSCWPCTPRAATLPSASLSGRTTSRWVEGGGGAGSHTLEPLPRRPGSRICPPASPSARPVQVGMVRDIQFITPVKAKIGPPQAVCHQTQRLKVWAPCGRQARSRGGAACSPCPSASLARRA